MMGEGTCAIVPTLNHVDGLPRILEALLAAGLPVIVIDDGSTMENGARIAAACDTFGGVECLRHSFNGGKGFAVLCGLARAAERGFTSAVQIDADGQHDLAALPQLLETATAHPEAFVVGEPVYDRTIPLGRRAARWLTTVWVAINALSFRMPDAMCGFRVYPVGPTLKLVREQTVRGRRMDFDIEILVKARWAGLPIRRQPVLVTYPAGHLSNFDLFYDNVLLTAMQTRLFFGMLVRAPGLILSPPVGSPTRADDGGHWASVGERGAYVGLLLLSLVYRGLGQRICLAVMFPVVAFFYVTGRAERLASRGYLMRAWRSGFLPVPPTAWTGYRHFLAFGNAAFDKLRAWIGQIPVREVDGLEGEVFQAAETAGGAFVLTAHLGNPEVLRAIARVHRALPVNVLVHTVHAEMFNRLIRKFAPGSPVRVMQVTRVGPDTAIMLRDAIERGEWVVMAADRVPVDRDGRVVEAPFMGEPALFPQGPFVLGSVLQCPVYLMFCTKRSGRFQVSFTAFADRIELPRGARPAAIGRYAARYAAALEREVAKAPLQWFNFYDFWSKPLETRSEEASGESTSERRLSVSP